MSLSNPVIWGMNEGAVYLWTLPMFHCNGWCFTWTLAAVCGMSLCLRQVTAKAVWKPEWDSLPPIKQARLNARQGVRYVGLEGVDVVDTKTKKPIPADGITMGEIVMRGNLVMKGYLKNPKANE